MSYDVYFVIDAGGEEPIGIGESFNYTYNCGPMFRKALGGDGINDLHDQNAGSMVRRLEDAVRDMADPSQRAAYEAMNPPDKWGSHEGAAKFVSLILAECRRIPKATVKVC